MSDSWLDLYSVTDKFLTKPNWSTLPNRGFSLNRELVQYDGTGGLINNLSDKLINSVRYGFSNLSKSDEFDLLTFFNNQKGALKRFWLPVWKNYFSLAADVTALSDTILINDIFFEDIFQGYERFFMELKNGDMLSRHIVDVTDNGDGTETLLLESIMNRNILQTDVVYFGKFILCRLNTDELEINHINNFVSETIFDFTELVQEYSLLQSGS